MAKREKMLRCHLQWNRRWPRHHSWAMLSSRPTQKLFILHYAVSVDVNATVRECRWERHARCRLWGFGTWPWHTMIWFLFTQPDAAMGQHFINERNDLKWFEMTQRRAQQKTQVMKWWPHDDPRGALALRGVQAPHHLLLDMPGQLTFHNPSLTGMNVSWRYLIYYAHYAH